MPFDQTCRYGRTERISPRRQRAVRLPLSHTSMLSAPTHRHAVTQIAVVNRNLGIPLYPVRAQQFRSGGAVQDRADSRGCYGIAIYRIGHLDFSGADTARNRGAVCRQKAEVTSLHSSVARHGHPLCIAIRNPTYGWRPMMMVQENHVFPRDLHHTAKNIDAVSAKRATLALFLQLGSR